LPTNGSAAILKARALNGSLSSGRRTGLPCASGLADHRRHVERRGQVVDDRVEHRLDALVLERRAGQDGHDLVLEGAESQAALDVLG
jgi:hypothetical protein